MSTNGWGKASINNSNGFGDGAINNTNGWGDSQLKSWSGETDIDGGTGIPVNTVAPIISGATTLGSVLSTTNGTWTAKPAATFTYQWKRNGSNIIGATNSTYTLVNEDGATNITCQVTATNDFGSANATSNTLAIPAFTDADAQAFITAASITDPTQQSAINQLVVDLKGYNVWSKMKALYPFVGGTASQHKWNLKDPRDLDAAFRLVFNGGWTHSTNGINGNALNSFINTNFNFTNIFILNYNWAIGFYSNTNNNAGIDMGADSSSTSFNYYFTSSSNVLGNITRLSLGTNTIGNTDSNTLGFYIASKILSNQQKIYKNNSIVASSTTNITSTPYNGSTYIGSINRNGVSNFPTQKRYCFSFISEGLTDTEAANFYTAVQAFQTTLGRNV